MFLKCRKQRNVLFERYISAISMKHERHVLSHSFFPFVILHTN